MNFAEEYINIKKLVEEDLLFIEEKIAQIFSDKNTIDASISSELLNFLTAPSKRLRPVLGFLFLRCAFNKVNQSQLNTLLAIELIHNATLIHDDVIDDAEKRRNNETINSKFSNDLAVVSGDFLLSVAMEKVIETESIEVLKLFTTSLKSVCLGEFRQYFSKFNITSIDEYIEKSKDKTAVLFRTGIVGSLMLGEYTSGVLDKAELLKLGADFSENFGIAFQIRDDLLNIVNSDSLKPNFNDLNQGIYTAPVIFAYQDGEAIKKTEILNKIEKTDSIEKTKNLMDNYFNKALSALDVFEKSPYKSAMFKLVDLLKQSV